MTTRTAVRGRASTPAAGPPGPRSPRWLTVVLALTAVLAVLGGIWGMTAGRDADRLAATPVGTPVPGGVLRVEDVRDREIDHGTMPGMSMPEDVPAGLRRFSVTATLMATGDTPLRFTERDFTVAGPGISPVVPTRSEFREGSLTPGSALTGSLTFDVPDDATRLDLRFQGGEAVRLPELAPAGDHDGPEAPGGAGGHPPVADEQVDEHAGGEGH